jgi:hypothetical protein
MSPLPTSPVPAATSTPQAKSSIVGIDLRSALHRRKSLGNCHLVSLQA